MNRNEFKYTDERIYINATINEKYPPKCINVYEEDGIGLVVYYILQNNTPKKVIAKHIFIDNPRIQKIYMALRDWVSYDLPDDLAKGRHIQIYDRTTIFEKPEGSENLEKEKEKEIEMLEKSKWPIYSGNEIGPIITFRSESNNSYKLKLCDNKISLSSNRNYIGPLVFINNYYNNKLSNGNFYKLKIAKHIIFIKTDDFDKYYANVESLPLKYFK